MLISDEIYILTRRINFQIKYGLKPYVGKIYYKINNWTPSSGTIVNFYIKQPGVEISFRYEILMKFEMDFPGYELLDIREVYIPTINQTVYITRVYNKCKFVWETEDEINKLFTSHPDYELSKNFTII